MTIVAATKKSCFPWWIFVIIAIILLLVCMYFLGKKKPQPIKSCG